MSTLQLLSDGGCRTNVGQCGLGIVGYHVTVEGKKECIFEKGVYLDGCSNNTAEYLALIHALNYALSSDYKNIELYADAKLIVEQVNGVWAVKCEDLIPLANSAKQKMHELRSRGCQVTFKWIPRTENVHADSLANLAMDRKASAEYRRDIRHKDKMQSHFEAMLAHEDLIRKIVSEPKRAKIRQLKESFDKVVETWSHIDL